jgi:hypothetical protein
VADREDLARILKGPRDSEHIQLWLERALNPRHVVYILVEDLGFSDEAIAKMSGVHAGSVRRWRSKDPNVGDPRPPQAKAIERVRAIAFHFLKSEAIVDLKGVGAWFQQINPGLEEGSEAPADGPMTAERFEVVMRLAREFTRPGAGMAAHTGTRKAKQSEASSAQPTAIPPAGFGPPGAVEEEP